MVNTVIKLVPQTVRKKACRLFARGSAPRSWIKMTIHMGLSLMCTIILLANLDMFASGRKFFSLRSDPGGNNVARPLCPDPPGLEELMTMIKQSPIVVAGRMRQRLTSRSDRGSRKSAGQQLQVPDQFFNISVFVTVQYKTVDYSLLNSVISVGLFYTPVHDGDGRPGCLDSFYPNSKYILPLKPIGLRQENYYLLSGPPVPYSDEYEQAIYANQCNKCCKFEHFCCSYCFCHFYLH